MSTVADEITDSITDQAVSLARVPNQVAALQNAQSLSLATMGGLLQLAVERGLSPEAIEKLVDLHERLSKAEAERQFNHAVQLFQAKCPTVTHSKEADTGKFKYTYSEMSHIAATIRPLLDELGLSYSFDSTVEANRVRATCTVHHVAGHSRSASFESGVCGSPAMNEIQKTASTVTYGKRQALLMALGIMTADHDDDGRHWSDPSPKPDVKPDAPTVAPRGDRPASKASRMKSVYERWVLARPRDGTATSDKFRERVETVLQRSVDFLKMGEFTEAEVARCEMEVK